VTGRRLAALMVGALGVAVAAGFAVMSAGSDQARPPTPPRSAAAGPPRSWPVRTLPPAPPVRLEIPKIGVRTSLMTLGKNADRTVQVPPLDRADQAGWYRWGAAPGRPGPAVIIG